MHKYNPHDSIYRTPKDAEGLARVYGLFKNCSILGHACDIQITELPDADPQATDILGFSEIRRSAAAIHISGLDPFGKKTGPGFIRALALYEIKWADDAEHHAKRRHPSGMGCEAPEAALIVSWDRDHYQDRWQNHIFFCNADSFVTLGGIYLWWKQTGGDAFEPRDILASVDELRGRTGKFDALADDKQHLHAVRRLLESAVGVSNNYIGVEYFKPTLQRVGRWQYEWKEGQ